MTTATQTTFRRFLTILETLEQAGVVYRLAHVRDSVMIELAVPGERWEIEFLEDGDIEIERFVSRGVQRVDDDELTQLIANVTT